MNYASYFIEDLIIPTDLTTSIASVTELLASGKSVYCKGTYTSIYSGLHVAFIVRVVGVNTTLNAIIVNLSTYQLLASDTYHLLQTVYYENYSSNLTSYLNVLLFDIRSTGYTATMNVKITINSASQGNHITMVAIRDTPNIPGTVITEGNSGAFTTEDYAFDGSISSPTVICNKTLTVNIDGLWMYEQGIRFAKGYDYALDATVEITNIVVTTNYGHSHTQGTFNAMQGINKVNPNNMDCEFYTE